MTPYYEDTDSGITIYHGGLRSSPPSPRANLPELAERAA